MKVVISGGFDPVHIGHIDHVEKAKELAGDGELIVIVQNNENLISKKGYWFMDEEERLKVMESLKGVDEVVLNVDEDGTSIKSLEKIREKYPDSKMIFAKGGDRFIYEIPEVDICDRLDIEIIDGVGGHLQSSSGLVRKVVEKHD